MLGGDDSFSARLALAFAQAPHPRVQMAVRAGPMTLRLGFQLEHLATAYSSALIASASTPDASISIVAGDEVDLTELIPHPWDQGRAFGAGDYFAMWHPDKFPVLYLADLARKCGLVWLPRGQAPDWEFSRPLCPLIQAFLTKSPWTAVHAASVSLSGRSLLLAGRGRAGKSTAALSCAMAGWDYAGDDYVCVNTTNGDILPLYTSARLRTDMTEMVERLLPVSAALSNDLDDPRHELRLGNFLGPARIKGGTLAAILLPRRRGAVSPKFEPARRADALEALFKTTMLGVSGSPRTIASKLGRLVALAPATFVDTGTRPDAIPPALVSFLGHQNS